MVMIALALLLGLLAPQEEPLSKVVERWRQEDPKVREAGSREVLGRWKTLSAAELDFLSGLEKDSDREFAARATSVLRAIRFRRSFGEAVYPKIEKADALILEQRAAGTPVQLIGWGMPGGPLYQLDPRMRSLVELGFDVEPLVRSNLADPALTADIAVVLMYLGNADSVPALIEALPGREGPLTPAEGMIHTTVLETLYRLTGAEIGAHSREHDPYTPELRKRWQRWYGERKDYLYSPPAPAPRIDHVGWVHVDLDVEAWVTSTPAREYRKAHPLIALEEAEKKPDLLREFCLQRLLCRVWRYGRWNHDAFYYVGAVDDPRCLAVLKKVAEDPSADSFALNRCAFALRSKGESGFPALEKLATERKEKDAQYPYRWAKVERTLGHRRYDRRIQLEEGELLARCVDDAAARREFAVELGKDRVSKGLLLMAESVPDAGVIDALRGVLKKEQVSIELRQRAAGSLGMLKADEGTEFLRARLDDAGPVVRLAAAENLWRCSNREGFKTLIGLLELRPLTDGHPPANAPTSTPPKANSSLFLIRRACELLGEMGDPGAVGPLRKLLAENLNGIHGLPGRVVGTGWFGRPDVVALAKLGDLSGIDLLIRSIANSDPLKAAGDLGTTGDFEQIGLKRFAKELLPLFKIEDSGFDSHELPAIRSIVTLLDKGR